MRINVRIHRDRISSIYIRQLDDPIVCYLNTTKSAGPFTTYCRLSLSVTQPTFLPHFHEAILGLFPKFLCSATWLFISKTFLPLSKLHLCLGELPWVLHCLMNFCSTPVKHFLFLEDFPTSCKQNWAHLLVNSCNDIYVS